MASDGNTLAFVKTDIAHQSSKKVPRLAFALAVGSLMLATSGEAKGVHQRGQDLLPGTWTRIPDRFDTRSFSHDLFFPRSNRNPGQRPLTRRPICFNSGNSLVGIFPNRGYDVVPSLFWKQEKKREIVCTPSMAHILTDHRLIQIPLDDNGFSSGLFMSDSLEKIHDIGLAAWAQSDTADFLITNDARISVITPTTISKTYRLPTGIKAPKMTTHDGFVFISNGLGSLIVADPDMRHVIVPIICDPAGDFSVSGNSLFFGRAGRGACSISVAGNDVTGVKVEKK